MQSRTHTCGELRLGDAGKKVMLSGWLENFREVGAELGFVLIRYFYTDHYRDSRDDEDIQGYHKGVHDQG